MGKRLSKIVTKTGDDGTTGLALGKRVSKASEIIEAIGTVDELNSCIGMARVVCNINSLDDEFKQLQHNMFNIGGDLCLEGSVLICQTHIDELESSLQKYNSQLKSLENFILPTGSEFTARIHMARSICRRTERCVVKASKNNDFRAIFITNPKSH